jgi:glycosyltransferase involved in cell wall biosynthesis
LDIIVVDDGSTDNTAVLVRRIQSVRLIQLPSNRRAAEALNIGFRGARGEFVCWLSADDAFVFPDKIMKQVEEMRRTEADWSYYTESYVGRSMDEARLFEPFSNCLMKFPRLRVFAIMVHNPINGSSIMLRRSSLKKYGTFDPTLKNVDADGELWMRWASKGAKLAILNGPGVFYRTHKGQTSRKRVNQRRGQLLSRARFMLRGLRN